jgi:uncharacterized protein YndB with AHSA1/START domain
VTYHVVVEAEIPAPVEAVFDFVADMRNDPRWAPMVKSVQQTGGTAPFQGANYRVMQWMGPGKYREVEIQLSVYQRPARLEWRMANRSVDYRSEMRFEATGEGTHLIQANRTILKHSRMPRWLAEMLARRQLNKQLKRLRRIFEAYDFSVQPGPR